MFDLAEARIERFCGGTDDGLAMCGNGEEHFEEIVEWFQLVHPNFIELEPIVSAIHELEVGGGNDLREAAQRTAQRHRRKRQQR